MRLDFLILFLSLLVSSVGAVAQGVRLDSEVVEHVDFWTHEAVLEVD